MDINHLLPDELEIELNIRLIDGDEDQRITQLREQMANEETYDIKPPNRPHKAAYKAPKTEILRCSQKLMDIRDKIKQITEEGPIDVECLKCLGSRLIHVSSRLDRMCYSPSVGVEAKKLNVAAEKLFAIIDTILLDESNNTSRTENMEKADDVEITKFEEDFASDEQKVVHRLEKPSASSPVGHHVELDFKSPSSTSVPNKTANVSTQSKVHVVPHPTVSRTLVSPSPTVNQLEYPPGNSIAGGPSSHHPSTTRVSQADVSLTIQPQMVIPRPTFNDPNGLIPPSIVSTLNQAYYPPTTAVAAMITVPPPVVPIHTGSDPNFRHQPPTVPFSFPANFAFPANLPAAPCVMSTSVKDTNTVGPQTPFVNSKNSFSNRSLNLNLSYDGSVNGPPIERFLFRVEVLANSLGIPRNNLITELHFLLRGQALEYYWICLGKHYGSISWDMIKSLMLERFRDRRTDMDIRRTIDSRKQRKGESFLNFYSEILNLSMPLRTPLNDDDLLAILIMNMSLELQVKLAGESFNTVPSLLDKCVAIEDVWNRVSKQTSSFRGVNELDSNNYFPVLPTTNAPEDFVTNQIEAFKISSDRIQNRQAPHRTNANGQPFNSHDVSVCWNCHSNGHIFKNCTAGRILHTFCFGCGAPNIFKPNCQNCNKSGNQQMGTMNTGAQRFHQNQPCQNPSTEEAASNTDPEFYRLLQRPQ